ncbi:hypothetical protein [Burkholderia perseverans]|uniref:hypothetical protein n=1 Tax=Burkholderia perseverans TaxID=2615214 RepID=UPI001FF02705|nr:hypothetical protein [Burkholderia perseverans]
MPIRKYESGKGVKFVVFLFLISGWFSQYHPVLFIFCVLFFLGFAIVFFYCLVFRRGLIKRGWWWVMSMVSMLVWMILISLNRNDGIFDYLEVRSEMAEFQVCKDDGVSISSGGKFSICKTEEYWWRSGFVRSIIYDSSGQILYLNKRQTSDWSAATLKLGNGLAKGVAPDRGGLFGISPYDARHLYGNYYIVDFYNPS